MRGADRAACRNNICVEPFGSVDEPWIIGELDVREALDRVCPVGRWGSMVERSHVVDEAEEDMREGEALGYDVYGCCAFGAVAEDGRGPPHHLICGRQKWQNFSTIPGMQLDVAEVCQACLSKFLVRVISQFNGVNKDFRHVLRQHIRRLPASPSAFYDHLNAEPAARFDDQRHLTMRDAAMFVGLSREAGEEVGQRLTLLVILEAGASPTRVVTSTAGDASLPPVSSVP